MIAEKFTNFKLRLGEVNVHICSVDAVLADAIERIHRAGDAERQLEQIARKQQYYLGFNRVPDLRGPLGSFGIVFQHQVLEGFYQDLEDYLRGRSSYKSMDPNGTDPRPKGEDLLRRLVRKLNLLNHGQQVPSTYENESAQNKAQREEVFCSTIGRVEAYLMEYYRLVRNAAVHMDIDRIAETYYRDHFVDTRQGRPKKGAKDAQQPLKIELEKIERLYKGRPAGAGAISIADMILYSRVMQSVARKLLIIARPDIETEVLPFLQKKALRYRSADRRRKAIIGALCTDYLVDITEAQAYAERG